jgi:hypothetical protein
MRSFNIKRKFFALFLGPLHRPFFHQRLEGFLLVVFPTVLAFTHVNLSSSVFVLRWQHTTGATGLVSLSSVFAAD